MTELIKEMVHKTYFFFQIESETEFITESII